MTRNPLGRITAVLDALGNTTSYQYAAFGNLASVTGPDGDLSAVNYNAAGYRTSLVTADLGGAVQFEVNSLGEVTQKTDAALKITNYGYDKLGRMTQRTFPGAGGENRSWTYATSGNAAGRLIQATRANGFTRDVSYNARLYDPALGRFLSVDLLIAHPGSNQAINPYSYVENNPLNKTDPTGMAGEGTQCTGSGA